MALGMAGAENQLPRAGGGVTTCSSSAGAGPGRAKGGTKCPSPVAGAFTPALFIAQLRNTTRVRFFLRIPRRLHLGPPR